MASKSLKFDASARLQSLLGRELISNDYVAMAELVRNAYDAGAKQIIIKLESGDPQRFIITDDGRGMSQAEFERVWMRPGYSEKADTETNASALGEKGIGRFAVDKISHTLIITTKITTRPKAIRVKFDWDRFLNQNKKLREIAVQLVDVYDEELNHSKHGTRLELSNLRRQWKPEDWRALRDELKMLILPRETNRDFKIIANSSSWESGELVPRFEGSDAYEFFFSVSKSGKGLWTVSRPKKIIDALSDSGHKVGRTLTGSIELPTTFGPTQGRFFFFDRAAQITQQGFEAGVGIYRDGFRVEPYGRSDDDWVEIRLLKSKRHGKVPVTPSRLFGYVEISRALNPRLRDLTNREGLQDSPEFADFKKFVIDQFLNFAVIIGEDKGHLPVAKSITAQQRSESRETKSEELATLADQLAHQLKQPLTIIGTNIETMRLHLEEVGAFDKETQKYHDRIDGSVSRLDHSIEGLTSLSKDLKGRATNFDLVKAVKEIVNMHEEGFAEHGIALNADFEDAAAKVKFSKPVLNFVLENFLTNALKATTAAENHEPVVVRIANLEGGRVRVLVEDSGIKIPVALAKTLFDQPVTSSESGWGKGLYYSRLRVEPFNGTLDWFAGEDSKTFYLDIG